MYSGKQTNHEPRRDPRYSVQSNSALAHAPLVGVDDNDPIDAVLFDISQGGARFSTHGERPQVGIKVDIDLTEHGGEKLRAKIRWVVDDIAHGCVFGCSFDTPLSLRLLDILGDQHLIERRLDIRREVIGNGEVKTALDREFTKIEFLDMSGGGFRASCHGRQLDRNDRLLVKMEDDIFNPGAIFQCRVMWVKECENDEVQFGCSFMTRHEFPKLESGVSDPDAKPHVLKVFEDFQPRTRWVFVAASVGCIAFALSRFIFPVG